VLVLGLAIGFSELLTPILVVGHLMEAFVAVLGDASVGLLWATKRIILSPCPNSRPCLLRYIVFAATASRYMYHLPPGVVLQHVVLPSDIDRYCYSATNQWKPTRLPHPCTGTQRQQGLGTCDYRCQGVRGVFSLTDAEKATGECLPVFHLRRSS
jgi:hypothetical protein